MPKKRSAIRLLIALALLCVAIGWMMVRSLPDLALGIVLAFVMREVVLWEPHHALVRSVEGVFNWFAKFSYTTYLLHMLVMVVLMNGLFTSGKGVVMMDKVYFNLVGTPKVAQFTNLTASSFGWYLFAIALAFAVSYIAWWLVERNTGRILKLISR